MKSRRKIIRIDEEKCNGCGQCATACAEGAIKIIDGKARLVSEVYCDGLGACIGECPQGALTIKERDAAEFDEKAVERHLAHEKAKEPLPCGCPGTMAKSLKPRATRPSPAEDEPAPSALRNWPVQLRLVPVFAPYFNGAELVVSADCVPFSFADFHKRFLAGRALVVGCPKLDDVELYREKLAQIFAQNEIKSIEVVYMEVPCCFGLVQLVRGALEDSAKNIPLTLTKVGVQGEILATAKETSAAK
jgi:Fe-S-cluster-containing hydrogenase component 2